MFTWLDNFLNRITTYRLMLYVLLFFVVMAAGLGFAGQLPYSGWSILLTALYFMAACWLVNIIFARTFGADVHDDSAYITGLILSLIIAPYRTSADVPLLLWAPILAMAGKYIVAIRKQHVFNPTALAVAVTALTIHQSATWWIGTSVMMPAVLIGGYLIIRKVRRWDVVISFLVAAIFSIALASHIRHGATLTIIHRAITSSSLLFFCSIMLIEPATMPPTRRLRLAYGLFIGLLFAPQIHVGSVYSTPELALLTGNALFYLCWRRHRHALILRKIVPVTPTVSDFIFTADGPISFRPGQYFEWALPHLHPDSRGVRRYFTVASSPTESLVRIGVKFYSPASSYKQALLTMRPGQRLVVGQLDGDFTLPPNPQQPLAFIAGGIGVTPFRSIIKYLLDTKQPRPITMLYANAQPEDIAYTEIFEQARADLGINTSYVLSDERNLPTDWAGERGFINADMIQRQIPDYPQRIFYISGPQAMVDIYKKILLSMGLGRRQIKTDYFPGFA